MSSKTIPSNTYAPGTYQIDQRQLPGNKFNSIQIDFDVAGLVALSGVVASIQFELSPDGGTTWVPYSFDINGGPGKGSATKRGFYTAVTPAWDNTDIRLTANVFQAVTTAIYITIL